MGAGFQITKKTALIEFEEGHEYYGLSVLTSLDVSMEVLFSLDKIGDKGSANAELLSNFGDQVLIEWNLTDSNDEPIPATGAGFMKVPLSLAAALMRYWSTAATDVPGPLDRPSRNGST